VAAAFENNGSGVRGDLQAVWTAILTEREARSVPQSSETLRGKLREPIVRFVQWARTAQVKSDTGAFEIYDMSSSDQALGQSPLRSPSVFNFFRPGYVPPGTALADAQKQAPEFQIHNETTTAGYINLMEWVTRFGLADVKPTYQDVLPFAHDIPAVIAWLNLRLCANQLSAPTIAQITAALASLHVTSSSTDDFKLHQIACATWLIMCSPEYLIQK
jgi:hypothetical protein